MMDISQSLFIRSHDYNNKKTWKGKEKMYVFILIVNN
jgi:hypothetical protein